MPQMCFYFKIKKINNLDLGIKTWKLPCNCIKPIGCNWKEVNAVSPPTIPRIRALTDRASPGTRSTVREGLPASQAENQDSPGRCPSVLTDGEKSLPPFYTLEHFKAVSDVPLFFKHLCRRWRHLSKFMKKQNWSVKFALVSSILKSMLTSPPRQYACVWTFQNISVAWI